MALDTFSLSRARAKFEEAKEENWSAAESSLGQALSLAGEALVSSRRANDVAAKLEALELVLLCNVQLGDFFAANLAVTDELAMIRRSKDQNAEIRCLQLAADVHAARGDGHGALDALQSAMVLIDKVEDGVTKVEDGPAKANTLSQLALAKLAVGKGTEALAPAQDALKLFQELGDAAGEKAARRNLNVVYAGRNQLDKAPDRPEALQALKDLAAAVDSQNTLAWGSAMEALERTGAYTQKDIDEVASDAVGRDRFNASAFLEEQGIVVQSGTDGKPQLLISEYPKQMHYISMRVGGLGYGPRFRCGQFVGRKQVAGDPDSLYSTALLQCSEEADDWERDIQYHPGILDSMLQSSGLAVPTW